MMLAGFIFFGHITDVDRFNTLVRMRAHDQKDMTVHILAAQGKVTDNFLVHYSHDEKLLSFMDTADKQWADESFNAALTACGTNGILVYKPDGSLFYSVSRGQGDVFSGFLVGKDEVARFFADSPVCHFFVKNGKGFVEARGAVIAPAGTLSRGRPLCGYLFFLHSWDKEYISRLEKITGSRWQRYNHRPDNPEESRFDVKSGEVSFIYDLIGFDGKSIGCFEVSYFAAGLRWLSNNLEYNVAIYFIFILFLLFVLFFVFIVWVYRPLNMVSRTLKNHDAVLAGKLKKRHDEFGQIAQVIEQYFIHDKTVRANNEKTTIFQKAILKLIQMEQSGALTIPVLLEHYAKALAVYQASVWFVESNKAVCEDRYKRAEDIHEKGEAINISDYPHYIKAITANRIVAADSAREDERTREFNKSHLEPFNIFSTMDAAIRRGGMPVGVLSCAHADSVRYWSREEQDFAVSVADLLSLKIETIERKRVEDKLKEAYDQLKAMQTQLVQSAKMVSLGTLSSGIAHEINNPLSGILNNVQLMKIMAKEKKDFNFNDFKELLASVEDSAVRCKDIIASLLDFAHSPRGNFVSLSLNAVAEKVVTILDYEMHTGNIMLGKELAQNLPMIKGNAQLLQQAVFDLIANARWAIDKKIKKGEGLIYLRTFYDAPGKRVALFVSDTGVGIPQAELSKIFDPFFTTKEVGEGTGLGLSIVYNIVKEHRGTIDVESQVNQGTTFKLYFPLG
jgi:signal transduction histidine kinase